MSTYLLVRHNRLDREPSPKEADAIIRLRKSLKMKNWGPDLIIKAFEDLDTVFFRGCLVGNCLLKWRDPKGCRRVSAKDTCTWYGFTHWAGSPAHKQAAITLSAENIFLEDADPYGQMWKVILVSRFLSSFVNCTRFCCSYFYSTIFADL